ncbi:uncharacterized protein DSM5745_00744 [Aspergillus mulundensis]|uniref:Uncharacterized protein n=1 Tax=Aspergillus mulundensis TaxID=1810919 RepID=A0A3D8T4D4_9EURO|nr:hypothetical protein DSM5745_00744 [Aspergillus mulundensis]RDW93422.1 hypothetical protein DSM5745_00744 [Aspergillus mulundensis]
MLASRGRPRAVFQFESRRSERGPTPGRRRSDRLQPIRRDGMYKEKTLDDVKGFDEESETTDEETTDDDSSGCDDDDETVAEGTSQPADPRKLSAGSPTALKRPAIAPPTTSPRENKRAVIDGDTSGRATEPNATPRSTQLRPIPRPARHAAEGDSSGYQGTTKTVPLKPPGRSAPRKSLGDDFQLDVNMYVIGHVQKVKRLEEKLERALAKNTELQYQLNAVRTQRDERSEALARRVSELTKEKTMMDEKAQKVEAFFDALKQLDTTGGFADMMQQASSAQG